MWLVDVVVEVCVDVVLPHRCPVCGAPGPAPCPACRAALPAPPALPPPPGLDGCVAVVGYRGSGRAVVADLKFAGRRSVAGWAGAELAAAVGRRWGPELVTWVPTTAAHRRQRGRDQAEVLAIAVGRALGVPARRLLQRRPGPSQAERDAAARRIGPSLRARGPAPASVLVVDDVITTGGSVAAAARALRAAGASTVVAAALARTPP